MRTTTTELVDLRAGKKVELVVFRDEPPRRPYPCGCILATGETHYCRHHTIIVCPPASCPHDVWDTSRDLCARCGTPGLVVLARALAAVDDDT